MSILVPKSPSPDHLSVVPRVRLGCQALRSLGMFPPGGTSFCSTRQTDVVGDWTWKVAILGGINNVIHKVLSLRNTTVRVVSWLPFLDESNLNFQIPPGLHHLGSLAIWSILESLRLAAKRRTRLPAEYIMASSVDFLTRSNFSFPSRPSPVQWIQTAAPTVNFSPVSAHHGGHKGPGCLRACLWTSQRAPVSSCPLLDFGSCCPGTSGRHKVGPDFG